MIIQGMIVALFGILMAALALMPEFPALDEYVYYFGVIADVWGYLSSFVYMADIATIIGVIILVDNFTFFVRVFSWIWEKIPFVN